MARDLWALKTVGCAIFLLGCGQSRAGNSPGAGDASPDSANGSRGAGGTGAMSGSGGGKDAGAAGARGSSGAGAGAAGASGGTRGAEDGGGGVGGSGAFGEGTNACDRPDNAAGRIVDLAWPSATNVHFATEGDTVRFHWDDGTPHNVLQVASFEGQTPPIGKFSDAGFKGQIESGPKTMTGSLDWNTGISPCGYRPGIYFFVDEENPAGGIVSVAVTTKDNPSSEYVAKPCSALSDPKNYRGRYESLAARSGCTQYEVNNFTTEAHFDWVEPTFGARQGDLIVFRWTGLHNVVQVHDATEDALLAGGFASGPRTNCVGGANYACINGSHSLGEVLIDTKDHRPGMVHISDGCAYGCANCPWECHGPDKVPTGTNMEFLLARPANRPPPAAGSCCEIAPSKGTACRLVDLYNDNEGMQFDYNVPVNRGDLVRMRWGGEVRIVQTVPAANGSPTKNARPSGLAMSAAVDCEPGPNWTCLGGNTADAELVLDVDAAIGNGAVETNGQGQKFFDFFAFGTNTDGYSSQDSGILLYVADDSPYSPNPPCP